MRAVADMEKGTFALPVEELSLFVRRWLPAGTPRAAVQIAHGVAEHGGRYARLAGFLNIAGYAVYADDHRGHGHTARTRAELGFFAERDGWAKCCRDLWTLNRYIARQHPGLPIILIGHSMGSFMAQQFIMEHGDALAGVVLCGSSGKPPSSIRLAYAVALVERLRLGRRAISPILQRLSFGAFNKPFEPARTPLDWLSRDAAEVDKYLADPLCGFPVSVQLSIDLIGALMGIADPAKQARIPRGLPVHIIAGTADPVSRGAKTLEQLLAAYRAAGLERVTHRFYPEARHELFNETNRDEVTRDVLAWLDGVTG